MENQEIRTRPDRIVRDKPVIVEIRDHSAQAVFCRAAEILGRCPGSIVIGSYLGMEDDGLYLLTLLVDSLDGRKDAKRKIKAALKSMSAVENRNDETAAHDRLCQVYAGSCCPWMGECFCQCTCDILKEAREDERRLNGLAL